MKKKLLSGIFALVLLVATGFGVSQTMKSNSSLSDMALMNVEALANNESGGGKYYECQQGTESSYGTREFWCGTCTWANINKSGRKGGCRLN